MRFTVVLVALVCAGGALANVIELPVDSADALSCITVQEGMSIDVVTEGDRTFAKTWNLSESTGWPGSPWYYAPIVDFQAANGGAYVDASAPGATIEFDVRYVQEGTGTDGSAPYDNGNFGIQVFAFKGPNWWDTADVWLPDGFPNPEPHGEWQHISIACADLVAANPEFDLTQFMRLEIHGSNARHMTADHIDLDNIVITPEPGALALMSLGLLCMWRRR